MIRKKLFIIPAIDWLGGPENRLHRFFEQKKLPFDNIEVLSINLIPNKVRNTHLNVFDPFIIKKYGGTASFYLINLLFLWINILRRIKKTNVRIVLSTNPILSLPVILLRKTLSLYHIFDFVDDIAELANQYTPSFLKNLVIQLVKFMERIVIKKSDKLIVSSRILEKKVRLLSKKNPYYIPNGVNISDFIKNNIEDELKVPIIGYVGGVYEWAGLEDLISTYPKVSEIIPNVEYHIYGTGDIDKKVFKLTEKYKNVKYFGLLSYDKVPKVMANFTIGVIPFRKSILTDAACPLKLFEYWASKTLVISRNLTEVQKIAGTSCLFFKEREDFATILIKAILNKELRNHLVNKGFENVIGYDWKELARKYFEVLKI